MIKPTLPNKKLLLWAFANGWEYIHRTEQIRDPQGFIERLDNWDEMPTDRRHKITRQMRESA